MSDDEFKHLVTMSILAAILLFVIAGIGNGCNQYLKHLEKMEQIKHGQVEVKSE